MVPIRTDFDNVGSDVLIDELREISQRKRTAADHIDAAIARHHERQEPADSAVQFREEEVDQQK